MKEYTLKSFSKGRLRGEDLCSILRLTFECEDMDSKVKEIYREVGLI